jgi:hypothetical protein
MQAGSLSLAAEGMLALMGPRDCGQASERADVNVTMCGTEALTGRLGGSLAVAGLTCIQAHVITQR